MKIAFGLLVAPPACMAWMQQPPLSAFASTRRQRFVVGRFLQSARTTTALQQSSAHHREILGGGDFAGFVATFSPDTGALIPVPEYLIPDGMLEWGQAPTSLETIVSEDKNQRQTLTILPDIGCGCDNLETTKTTETNLQAVTVAGTTDAAAVQVFKAIDDKCNTLKIDVSFPWNIHDEVSDFHRVRVSLQLDEKIIKSPVRIHLERRFDAQSSHGTIADGGGLDAQRVAQYRGTLLNAWQEFAAMETSPSNNDMIALPGNVTLAIADQQDEALVVKVGHSDCQVQLTVPSSSAENEVEARLMTTLATA